MRSSIFSFKIFNGLFLVLSAVSIVVFVAMTEWIIRTHVEPNHNTYRYVEFFKETSARHVVFGDSHAAYSVTGVADMANLAFGGDDFLLTSLKIRLFLETRKPRMIILQAGTHHFSRDFLRFRKENSETFLDLLHGVSASAPRVTRPLHRKELFTYWRLFFAGDPFQARQTFEADGARINQGSYQSIPKPLRSANARRTAGILAPVEDFRNSNVAREYKEVLTLAANHGIKVCLVSFPVSNLLFTSMKKIATYVEADDFFAKLANATGAVRLNLRLSRLSDDHFSDAHHVNRRGAAFVSRQIEMNCVKA